MSKLMHDIHTHINFLSPSSPSSWTPLSAQQWVNSYHRGVLENFPYHNGQPQDAHISIALYLESWKEIRQNMYNSTYLHACHTSFVLSPHTVFLPITLCVKEKFLLISTSLHVPTILLYIKTLSVHENWGGGGLL